MKYLLTILILSILPLASAFDFPDTTNDVNIFQGNLTNLSEMQDVNIPAPSDNQLLQFDSGTNNWIASTISLTDTNASTACSGTDYLAGNGSCLSPTGSGDITEVNTDGSYLSGGGVTGAISILLNTTALQSWASNLYCKLTGCTMTGDFKLQGFTNGSILFIDQDGRVTQNNTKLFFENDNGGKLAIGENSAMNNMLQVVKSESQTNVDSVKALIVSRNTETTNNNWAGFSWQTKDTDGDIYSGARILTQFTNHSVASISGDLMFDTRHEGTRSEKMRLSSEGNLNMSGLGNITAPYYFGDGSQLTGILTSDTNASTACSTTEVLLGNGTCYDSDNFYDDTDTTYTNGTGLSLVGTAFSLIGSIFSGSWNDLSDVPSGFADGIDNDTASGLTHLTNFTDDILWTSGFNSTFDSRDQDTTYTVGNKLYLSGTEFNINDTELNTSIEAYGYIISSSDTNASTACSGTTTYLDGEGNCDDISGVYADISVTDTNETTRFNTLVGTDCGAGNYSYGFDANGLIQCREDTEAGSDTNASTACSTTEVLLGNGTCYDSDNFYDDTDTTYTNGTGLSLVGTAFSLIGSIFSGSWNDLSDVPSGFADGIDNDTASGLTHLTNFTDDILWTSVFNSTFDSRDDDTTYTNGTGLSLTGDTFSIILSYFTDRFIELDDSFGGDVSGTYDAIVVKDDSHTHAYQNITNEPWIEDSQLPLANLTTPYCGNITGATSNLCTLVDSDTIYTAEEDLIYLDGTEFKSNKTILNSSIEVYGYITSSSDTNASTACSATEVLLGNGTCYNSTLFYDDTNTNTNCSVDDSCSGLAYDSEINKTYVDAQDSAQDACSEITGCIENAITDGNTNWDNSYGFYNDITNFTGTLTNDKICVYDSSQGIINCTYTDQTGAGGNVKSGDGTYTYNDTDTIYFNSTYAGINLEVNGSDYWDNLGSPSDINTGDLTDDGTYRLQSWDNITGIPHATPSDGDTTHFSLADEIYDFVIGLSYLVSGDLVGLVGNWSADKGDYSTTAEAGVLYATIDEPLWSGNYTAYNDSWSSTYNSTYDAYNNTGLIKDWNSTGYITNWNSTGYIIDWNNTGLIINWSGDYITEETDPIFTAWDNITGIPHATPSDGDTTHFSLADEIYDWVISLGYLTSISNIFNQDLNTTSGVTFENVSTKAIYGNGDVDTYINWTGTGGDQLELFAGGISFIHLIEGAGSGIAFNQDSNDIDWRVESNDHTHALAVDGGTNKVRMENYTNCDTIDTDASGILSCGTDADTQLTEDQVEAYIFDDDNTANLGLNGYNTTNVSYSTFCNGANCWKMYVNASDYFIIEEI